MRYLFPARRCRLGSPFVLNGFRRVRYTWRMDRNSFRREWLLILLVISYFEWRFNIEKAVKNGRGKKENFETHKRTNDSICDKLLEFRMIFSNFGFQSFISFWFRICQKKNTMIWHNCLRNNRHYYSESFGRRYSREYVSRLPTVLAICPKTVCPTGTNNYLRTTHVKIFASAHPN